MPRLKRRQTGNCLDQKVDHTCKKEVERQGEPVHPLIDRLHFLRELTVPPFFQYTLPALFLLLEMPLDIFFFQISDFSKKSFDIRFPDMNTFHV